MTTGDSYSGENKLDVLQTMYTQVQGTALTIRTYMMRLTSGTSALFIALDGWILTSETILSDTQKIGIVVGILLLLGVSSFAAYRFYREFLAVGRLIVFVETGLHVYENDFFIPGRSLYPPEYQELGMENYEHSRHILLGPVGVMTLFGVFSILVTTLAG